MSSLGQVSELESLRLRVVDLERELAARDQSAQVQQQSLAQVTQDLRAQSDLLSALTEGALAGTGDEFFTSLATHLTASLQMQYVVIGEIVTGTPVAIHTLAVASGGALLDNFEYDLAQAPWGTALTESFWCYEQRVQALFPHVPLLAALGVESHSGVSIRNEQGEAVGVIVVMDTKPITNRERLHTLLRVYVPRVAAELQRKDTEAALREQTLRLAHTQALLHLGSWDWEIGSGRMEWSDEQFRIFGHEPGAVTTTHETFLATVLPEDHDRVLAAMNATLVAQVSFDLECRIIRPDGEVRDIHVRGEVHRDATGQPIGMAGTVLDITGRKQAEEARRVNEERWHLAVQGSNDGIWDWNVQTGEVFFSARWKAMRGYGEDELSSSLDEWRSRIHPDDLDGVLRHLDRYLAKQSAEFCQEYRVQRKDGSYLWVLERGVAIWNEAGTVTRMAGSESDITERKGAEAARRENDRRLRFTQFAVDHACDAILWADDSKRFIYVNEAACQSLGYSQEELLAMSVPDIVPYHDPAHFQQRLDHIKQGQEATYESIHRRKDGTEFPIEISVTYLEQEGRGYTCGIARDITERKRAEAALCQRERDLRTVLDALPVGVWCTDATGNVRLNNPAGCRIWAGVQQVGLEDTEGHPGWWEQASSSGEPHRWALARALTKGEATLNEELTIQCRDGTNRVIINSAVPLFGEAGQVSGAIVVNQDITERKALERDRSQTQAFLQSILENIPHIITVKDAKILKLVRVNRAAEQVLGADRHSLIDKTLYDYLSVQEADALWAADIEALQRRVLVEVPDHVMKRAGARDRTFQTKTVPILDAEGEPQYILTISEDITDRKRMEETLRRREQDLCVVIEERERISQDLHDGILQSLFAVGLGLEACKSTGPVPNGQSVDASLDQAIDQLNRVIGEIRNFIEGLGSDPLQGRDLPTALRHMVASLTQNQPMHVKLAFEDRATKAVSPDHALHVFHVIQEAMSNCIRHGRAQEARVSLKMMKQGVRLSIRDNGCGFDPEVATGAGHGLLNMAARAQKVGGRLSILSKINKGTRIVFDLPKEAARVRR